MLRQALVLSLLAFALPSFAQDAANERPRIKVSLSRDNMELRTMKKSKGELVEFFLFHEGGKIRGVDFGLNLKGGEFIGFLPNFEDRAWSPLLVPDPYPGTICQAGTECYDSPCYLGKVLVRMKKPNEKIVCEVAPSAFKQHALVLNCDYSTTNGITAYPAALNAPAPEPHTVDGEDFLSKGWPEANMDPAEVDRRESMAADSAHAEHEH